MAQNPESKINHNTISNMVYMYRMLYRFDKGKIPYIFGEVLSQSAVGFITIYLPAFIIQLLEKQVTLSYLILSTMAVFAGYAILAMLNTYLIRRNVMQYIYTRFAKMHPISYEKIMTLDYQQFETERTQKKINSGLSAVWSNNEGAEGMLHKMTVIWTCLLSLILYASIMSKLQTWILLLLIGVSLVQFLCFQVVSRYEVQHKDEKAKLDISMSYFDRQAYNTATGKDIRLYQLQDWLTRGYEKVNHKYRNFLAKERFGYFANDLLGLVLQCIREGVCYWYLIGELQKGMEVSQFVLYLGIIAGFSTYFNQLTQNITELGRDSKRVSYFRDLMDLSPDAPRKEHRKLSGEEKPLTVIFDHVTFQYPESEYKVLDDVSFAISAGEKMALVGVNGAGKTTIVKLICGFYQPTGGKILINGIETNRLDQEDYMKAISAVFQDSFLMSFTIGENVTCQPEGTYEEDRCREAIKEAGLWDKIRELPLKERTYLGKEVEVGGIQLSGGQIQKLMLARALYHQGKLLLLDEPTAALDAIAENEIYHAYCEIMKGKTSLFISHRLASTRFCDHILFLEEGRIREEGTHEELMNLEGSYAHMFQIQSQYYQEGGEEDEDKKQGEQQLV